jgi:hypothetical protein
MNCWLKPVGTTLWQTTQLEITALGIVASGAHDAGSGHRISAGRLPVTQKLLCLHAPEAFGVKRTWHVQCEMSAFGFSLEPKTKQYCLAERSLKKFRLLFNGLYGGRTRSTLAKHGFRTSQQLKAHPHRIISRSITGNLSNKIIQKGLAFRCDRSATVFASGALLRSGIPPRRLKSFCGASAVQPGGCT